MQAGAGETVKRAGSNFIKADDICSLKPMYFPRARGVPCAPLACV
jgi:hypothetical protein